MEADMTVPTTWRCAMRLRKANFPAAHGSSAAMTQRRTAPLPKSQLGGSKPHGCTASCTSRATRVLLS